MLNNLCFYGVPCNLVSSLEICRSRFIQKRAQVRKDFCSYFIHCIRDRRIIRVLFLNTLRPPIPDKNIGRRRTANDNNEPVHLIGHDADTRTRSCFSASTCNVVYFKNRNA